ncbi:MAG: virulence RhuM family protein [Desulfocapsa sp.]|nr:virulence RhuM family protein [Desulfocapsa sp.]
MQLEGTVKQYLTVQQEGSRTVKRKLDGFLSLNDRGILNHAGKVSHKLAKQIAEREYSKFNMLRIKREDLLAGDFEKTVQQIPTRKVKK